MGPTAFVVATQRAGAQLSAATSHLLAAIRRAGGRIVVAGPHLDPHSEPERFSMAGGTRWVRSAGRETLVAYATGVRLLDRSVAWGRVVLIDDSCVALNPEQLLDALLTVPDLDVASLTMISRPRPQLHVDWLVFQGAGTLQRSSFFDWWDRTEAVTERSLTDHLAAAGLRVGPVFRPDRAQSILAVCRALAWDALPLEVPASGPYRLDPDVALGLDPRIYLWDEIMARYAVLSAQLLRSPPQRINLEPLRVWLAANPAAAGIVDGALQSSDRSA